MNSNLFDTTSRAALLPGLIIVFATIPASAQTTEGPRRITLHPAPSPTPSPTPTASPAARVMPSEAGQPPARRIVLERPAPAPTPNPAPNPASDAQAAQPPERRIILPRRLATPTSEARQAAPVAPTHPTVVLTGPIRFNIDAKPTLAELSQIDPVGAAPKSVPAGAMTLKQANYADLLRNVTILRQLNFSQIKANPKLPLDKARLDLTPLLTRRGSLPMVAQQLQARPNLGIVNVQDVQVTQVRQGKVEGLLVRSFLNYQLKPGACSGSNRGQVESLGFRCARRVGLSDAELTAAFNNPNDVHYVKDASARTAALARARRDSKLQQAEVLQEVANFRATLNGGPGRQPLRDQIGDAEMQRLSALSDDDLAAELINTAENKVEQVMFVPGMETIEPLPTGLLRGMAIELSPPAPPAPLPPEKVSTETSVKPATYLTGFTLGKAYEWSYRVEKTIKWCLVGCKKHYYAHAYANLSYGFGLRFPIRVSGTYRYDGEKLAAGQMQNGVASYVAQFQPINGNVDDYLATGLPSDKVFNGKELVAEAKAGAGFDAHIPIFPDPPSLHVEVGKDFTELLPAPFAGGNFLPPAKGETRSGKFIFDQFDMLGGRLNLGIVGAQVFPAIEIGLHSDNVSFQLRDNVNGNQVQLTDPGQKVPLALDKNQMSSFTIDRPLYNVGFVITPGIDARLFIDIGVWGHTWDFPMFFPELTIQIPKDGVDFACHGGTICSRKWEFTTIAGKTTGGSQGAMVASNNAWGPGYDARWLPRCEKDETCEYAVKIERLGTTLAVQQILGGAQWDTATEEDLKPVRGQIRILTDKAEGNGAVFIKEMEIRRTGTSAEAISELAKAVWTRKCKDKDCFPEINAIAKGMGPRAKQVQAQNIDLSATQVIGMVGKEFVPQFQAAIDRSMVRAGVDAIGTLAEAVWTKKCPDDPCRTNIQLLVGKMLSEARAIQKANPDMSSPQLNAQIGPKYGKLFQREVDNSKARIAGTPQ